MLYLYHTFNSDRHNLRDFVLYSILIYAVRLEFTFLIDLHITMTSPTVSDVLNDNTLAILQLIEAVLKIQPTVGAVLHAVKGETQLPSFLLDAESYSTSKQSNGLLRSLNNRSRARQSSCSSDKNSGIKHAISIKLMIRQEQRLFTIILYLFQYVFYL